MASRQYRTQKEIKDASQQNWKLTAIEDLQANKLGRFVFLISNDGFDKAIKQITS